MTVDASGNAYITGQVHAAGFPTQNPFQGSFGGYSDAFVTKLNPSGTALIYSTYLGRGDLDEANDIAVDGSGNAYIIGETKSVDFPTQNPFQSSLRGLQDAFVTKLSASGSTLAYSTYLGGSSSAEEGWGIVVDGSGNAIVADIRANRNIDPEELGVEDLGTFANPDGSLRLLTLHSAKGREFDAVCIVDLQEGRMPHPRGSIDESRRVLYVGVTRPRKVLLLSHRRDSTRSRFLREPGVAACLA